VALLKNKERIDKMVCKEVLEKRSIKLKEASN
jgi:hypothetical protein